MSTVTIVQLTDLHVRPEGIAAYRVCESNMMTERALQAVGRLSADAVVITGDLTDCGLASEYTLLAGMLRRHLRVPVHLIPGNHDRREVMRETLPGVRAEDGFIQFALDVGPVRLVMLDTVVPGAGHGCMDGGRLEWLDRTLSERPDAPTMIGMHHPPFVCGIAHMDAINLRDSSAFATVVGRHAQVKRIVCGHHHRPVTANVAHAIATISPSVAHQTELDLDPSAPAAFVLEPPGYQIHIWSDTAGFVSHTAMVERFPGPFPFTLDKDYPGQSNRA
jgi:3',5'-cyclic AMP phosphodiesterase CpdA